MIDALLIKFKKFIINPKTLVLLFFIVYLFVGLSVYDDYGLTWDDHIEYERGLAAYNFVTGQDNIIVAKYYGAGFELPAIIIQKIFKINDPRGIFLLRHLLVFLIFYFSSILFYFLAKYYFKNWKWGIIATIFLITTPRIFAHSFYNSKDLVFLSVFVISIFTLCSFIKKNSLSSAVLHGLATGFLIDIRLIGILLPLITSILLIVNHLSERKDGPKEGRFSSSLLYSFILIVITLLFWPILWENPLHHLLEAFREMSHYPWAHQVFYLGKYIPAAKLPWHYLPLWIFITTPFFYTFFLFSGLFSIASSFIMTCQKNARAFVKTNQLDVVILIWFFVPILMVILLRSTVYDSWRQLFFVYPAFILISVSGLRYVYLLATKLVRPLATKVIMGAALICHILNLILFIQQNHPHQNVYFNSIARALFKPINNYFEMDYWGLAYRQGFEYILENDPRDKMRVAVANQAGYNNINIIEPTQRARLEMVADADEADYFLTNYRLGSNPCPLCNDKYYDIKVYDESILGIYRLNFE